MPPRKPAVLSVKTIREAERRLSRSCKIMARLIATHGACPLAEGGFSPFRTLLKSIISQQLSARVADAIEGRVLEAVPDASPAGFLSVSGETLRGAGLSRPKVKYIVELASRVADGRLDFKRIQKQPDETVITTLSEVPGIGRWTAEMFLIFGLKRPDVLALGDAGLQRAVRLLYGEGATLAAVGPTWTPYRSVASWYLWRHLDVVPSPKKEQ